MLVDLHVHTSRYSACGKSTPDEMVSRAEQIGLGALVFTEHHVMWPADELAELQRRHPRCRLYSGIEIETREGEDLLLYGITTASHLYRHMPAADAAQEAYAVGGFVVLAHPFRYRGSVAPGLERLVDGVEVLSIHILNYGRQLAQDYADKFAILPLASSDAHHIQSLGLYALDVATGVNDIHELVRALRQKQYSLFSDEKRLAEANALALRNTSEVAQRLFRGEDDGTIAAEVDGFTGHMVSSLRKQLDYQHPLH